LQVVSNLLQESRRPYDSVARWGGEEFLVLLTDTSLQTAHAIAERIRQRIENHQIMYAGTRIPVTLSLGVTSVRPSENWATALNRSDEALYQGKNGGRNKVVSMA